MMRRKLLVSIAAGVGLVLMAVTSAGAAVVTNQTAPFTETVWVPCANGGHGENVDVTGVQHLVASLTINGSHGVGVIREDTEGTAVGEITGDTYQYSNGYSIVVSGTFQNGQSTTVVPEYTNLIGQGSAPNYKVRELYKLILNANGTFVVYSDDKDTTCQ